MLYYLKGIFFKHAGQADVTQGHALFSLATATGPKRPEPFNAPVKTTCCGSGCRPALRQLKFPCSGPSYRKTPPSKPGAGITKKAGAFVLKISGLREDGIQNLPEQTKQVKIKTVPDSFGETGKEVNIPDDFSGRFL